jgi:hypothetical protein
VGFGGIGCATAHLVRALGMRIYPINTSGTSPEPTDFPGTLQDLEQVLRESDVPVLSLPLTKATVRASRSMPVQDLRDACRGLHAAAVADFVPGTLDLGAFRRVRA